MFSNSSHSSFLVTNQTSLMSPFSFTLDEISSGSKKPYRCQQVLLKVSGKVLPGHHTTHMRVFFWWSKQYVDYNGSCKAGCFCHESTYRGVETMGYKKSTNLEWN